MNRIARSYLVASAALVLGLGFATGAGALPVGKAKGATLQELQQSANPEIAAAEQRLDQARAQLDLAVKQVNASKALLKAAQADLKAASSNLEALKLGATAQGLVEQTGMTPAKAAPVPIATRNTDTQEEAKTTTAPIPASDEGRIKSDYNSESESEPIQLR